MSVAFRRDSDEEHLEPKFERPLPAGTNLVTKHGLALIERQIADLQGMLAAAQDDETKAALKRDLRYWQTRQMTAELAPLPDGSKVEFGVAVRLLVNGKLRRLTIVGDDEADPSLGKVSFKAPLCAAMLGAEAGERVPFGGVADAIEILEILCPLADSDCSTAWRD